MINNLNIILPLLEFKEEGDFLYPYPKFIIFVKKYIQIWTTKKFILLLLKRQTQKQLITIKNLDL